jgi:hypothetical protein
MGYPYIEPILSIDSMEGSIIKMDIIYNFIKKLISLYRELSMILMIIDFPLWKDYIEMMDKIWR